MVRKWHKSPN